MRTLSFIILITLYSCGQETPKARDNSVAAKNNSNTTLAGKIENMDWNNRNELKLTVLANNRSLIMNLNKQDYHTDCLSPDAILYFKKDYSEMYSINFNSDTCWVVKK